MKRSAIAAALLLSACRRPPGPVLLVRAGAAVASADAKAPPVGLVLGSLSIADRARLADDLELAVERAECRKHPLFVDLEGVDPQVSLDPWRGPIGAAFGAARGLEAAAWTASDRTMSVRLAPRCEPAPGERCVDPFSDDPDARRARFLAWPIAYAIALVEREPGAAAIAARALRPLVSKADGTVALVVAAPEDDVAGTHRLATLARRARRWSPELRDLVASDSTAENGLPAALAAYAGPALLVVPRLGALARRRAFFEEVDAALAAAGVADRVTVQHGP